MNYAPSNLAIACALCNSKRGDYTAQEFREIKQALNPKRIIPLPIIMIG
jgi:5-methylcytosine-specific restriction endonuclease McrA